MNDANDLSNEVQELVWALVDEQATEGQVRRLERLLLDDDEARRTYVTCMQLHADLHFMLAERPRLPIALERVLQAEKASQSKVPPLPTVDLPASGSVAPMADGCV